MSAMTGSGPQRRSVDEAKAKAKGARGVGGAGPRRRALARGLAFACALALAAALIAARLASRAGEGGGAAGAPAEADAGAPGVAGAPAKARAPGAAGGRALDVARYDLAGEFDWARARLRASVTVTLGAAPAPPPRVVLDCRVASVAGARLPSGEALPFAFDPEAGTLAIELGARAAPGLAFVVDYEVGAHRGPDRDAASPLSIAALTVGLDHAGAGRVVSTFSEPQLARRWLPSHDDPADRAFFSVELRVGEGERLVANGERVAGAGAGREKYATGYPLPTYLMAFALGEFEVVERAGPRGLPLSVWHRRGRPGDYGALLEQIGGLVEHFEGLIGVPYPFEKYALVLVPDMPGGVEHASASFQDEGITMRPGALSELVTAHELAHQWFGDLVTVETWDDAWIKEGLASLLERDGELARGASSPAGAVAFGGDGFEVRAGEAARDRALPPERKYGKGFYGRSTWLFAQARSLAGEAAFWGALRGLLAARRFGAVGSDELLAALRPALGDEAIGRFRRAIDAKALPTLAIEALAGGGARVTLRDPEGALLAPMTVAWHRADGTVEQIALAPDVPLELARRAPGDRLVVDPRDVHPAWGRLSADAASQRAYREAVAPLAEPAGGG